MIWKAALAGATVIAASASVAAAGPNHATRSVCSPTVVNGVVRNCGPATAKLSKFAGVTFRKGTCLFRPTLFFLSMGTYTRNKRTNNGKQYFGLSVAGKLRNPEGGGVQAFSHGKQWNGSITAFHGSKTAGRFSAKGVRGSRGTATGSYRC